MKQATTKRFWRGAVILCTLGFPLGAGTARAETPAEAEVRKAMLEVIAAATRLEADGITARLDPGPTARYYVQGQAFNAADLSTFLKKSFADMQSQEVIWLESSARELAPDTVLWLSSGRNPVVEKSGRAIEYLLAETWLWKKTGPTWRAAHYHESFLEMPSAEKRARVQAALDGFAAGFKVPAEGPEGVMPLLEQFVRAHPEVLGSAFGFAPRPGVAPSAPYVSRQGKDYVRTWTLNDSDYTQSGWYSGPAKSGKPAWSEPYFDTYGGQVMMITYGAPIIDGEGVLLGVLTADLALY